MCGTTGRMVVGISTTAGLRSLTKSVLVCPTFVMSLVWRKDQACAIDLHAEECTEPSVCSGIYHVALVCRNTGKHALK